jgi:outer membrane protein OmpA-like peptidoglycan-associated protein
MKMKIRMFVTLLLCAVLALPALAQQSNSNSSTQPAASADQTAPAEQSMTATGKAPLQTERPANFWDGDEPSVAWLVLHPFASKGYVRRHLAAIQDRVSELDGLTASNSQQIKDVDTRAQHGIELASTKTVEADQHALDASNKAQMAQQTASTANTHVAKVETVVNGLDQYQASNQTVIRFRTGQSVLSKSAKDALDEMAARLKDQRGYVIEVQGFSQGSGQAAIATSQRMADSVERYLVLNKEIPAYRIYVLAMGGASVAGESATVKHTSRNRVEISVMKNDLDQLASSSDTTAPAK